MIKIGILGAGRFGKIHTGIIKQIPQFEITGFFDPDKNKADAFEKEFGVRAFTSAEELIDASDALDIVSTTDSHFALAQKCIRKFKHLFIEKPVTSTIEEAKTLLSMSTEAGVKVQAGHVERFNPAFLLAHNYVQNPVFIESHRFAEFSRIHEAVSVLNDLMVHDIDIMLQLVDSPIKKIHASSVGILNGTPDFVNARIEFENGCTASLNASRLAVKNMRITRVYQRDASISINFLENKTGIISKQDGQDAIQLNLPEVKPGNAIKNELERFADSILNNTGPAVSLEHTIRALTVAGMIQDKLKPQSNFFAERAIS
jgi:predicted dehydrogenase